VGPRTGTKDVERRKILPLPGLEPQFLGRLARSPSLYKLSHPGSIYFVKSRKCFKLNSHTLMKYILPCMHSSSVLSVIFRDHVAVCVSRPIVARQRLGKNPPIVARQRLGRTLPR
jgi:hypothetical protein